MGSAVFIEGVLFPNSCQIVVSSKLSPGQLMPPGGFVCLYFRGSVQFFASGMIRTKWFGKSKATIDLDGRVSLPHPPTLPPNGQAYLPS